MAEYSSWGQIAAYFDGDGSVDFDPGAFVLKFRLAFVDNWKPQLEGIKCFLRARGIRTGKVGWRKASQAQLREGARGVYALRISNMKGILRAAREMLPYSQKKDEELRVIIDYYGERITGNEAVERMNKEVEIGKRTGKIKHVNLPQLYSEGRRLRDILASRRARESLTVHVPDRVVGRMKKDYYGAGLSLRNISNLYGYGLTTVRRVLGRPH